VAPHVADWGKQFAVLKSHKDAQSVPVAQELLHTGGQFAPGVTAKKKQVHTPSVVEVVVLVEVVEVLVVVVVGATQLGPLPGGGPLVGQASQQLEHPVVASPPTVPPASVQRIAPFFVLHFGTDVVCGMQHVTKPGFPQTECAAHLVTALLQSFGRKFGSDGSRLERLLATPLTHFTYWPWLVKDAHGQALVASWRAATTAALSPGLSPHFAKTWAAPTTSRSDTRSAGRIDELPSCSPWSLRPYAYRARQSCVNAKTTTVSMPPPAGESVQLAPPDDERDVRGLAQEQLQDAPMPLQQHGDGLQRAQQPKIPGRDVPAPPPRPTLRGR